MPKFNTLMLSTAKDQVAGNLGTSTALLRKNDLGLLPIDVPQLKEDILNGYRIGLACFHKFFLKLFGFSSDLLGLALERSLHEQIQSLVELRRIGGLEPVDFFVVELGC
jgi:hypothetical protein